MVEQMTVNHEDIGSSPIRGDSQICLITPFFYTGSGAAVARLFWEQKVRGSNPLFPIFLLKAYSLMVERSTHNGQNVGSNPARLIANLQKGGWLSG